MLKAVNCAKAEYYLFLGVIYFDDIFNIATEKEKCDVKNLSLGVRL